MIKAGANETDQRLIKKMLLEEGAKPKQIAAALRIDEKTVESFCNVFKPPIKKGTVKINE